MALTRGYTGVTCSGENSGTGAEVMDVLNPQSRYVFPHSGTFTANPISMTAGMAAMLTFD